MSKRKSARKPFHQAMSDLIKTVKADAPTFILGANKGPAAAAPAAKAAPKPAASSRFSPFKPRVKAPGLARSPRRSPASPLSKGKPAMKSAKSRTAAARRPMIAALMALLLAFGGFYLYRHLSMPKVHVKHVATQWLDKSAGKSPQVIRHQAVTRQHVSQINHKHSNHVSRVSRVSHAPSKHHTAAKAMAKHKKVHSHRAVAGKGHKHKKKHAALVCAKPTSSVQNASFLPAN
ncbi:MAG: hypothetical protein NTZ90_17585 [Proteobacteria bacterium]|nr:hypothetical protein [Pseudomonadota bacterium]